MAWREGSEGPDWGGPLKVPPRGRRVQPSECHLSATGFREGLPWADSSEFCLMWPEAGCEGPLFIQDGIRIQRAVAGGSGECESPWLGMSV